MKKSDVKKPKNAGQIYNEKLNLNMDKSAVDKYVCIEPESEDYFLGMTEIQAVDKAKEKYPKKSLYVMKVQKKPIIVLRQAN